MSNSVLDVVSKEWEALTAAPFAFMGLSVAVAVTVVTLTSAFWGALLTYREAASIARIENLNRDLVAAKNREADLRERLGFFPRDRTKYTELTNAELVEIAQGLCKKIEDSLVEYGSKERDLSEARSRAEKRLRQEYSEYHAALDEARAGDDEQRFRELTSSPESSEFLEKWRQLQDDEFRERIALSNESRMVRAGMSADALLLREELMSRLPEGFDRELYVAMGRDAGWFDLNLRRFYENIDTHYGGEVIVDLLRLAESLAARDVAGIADVNEID